MAFTYLKVKSVKCLCLWSWSCHFGLGLVSSGLHLGLGLKNLVLITSLVLGHIGVSRSMEHIGFSSV